MSGAGYAIDRGLHGDWDLFSAYVDGELADDARRAVEAHVAACPGCRAELDGLRRVASRLRSLERAAPPPVLAEQVARRVAVAARRPGLVVRIEEALRRLPVESSSLMLFGVIVALAAITALFVAGVEEAGSPDRAGRQGTESAAPAAAGHADPADRSSGAGLTITTAVVHGRTFDRDGGLWRERHLGPEAGERARRVSVDDPLVRVLLDEEPRLRDLLAGSEGVLLEDAGGGPLLIEP